jgi:hypothetical protein
MIKIARGAAVATGTDEVGQTRLGATEVVSVPTFAALKMHLALGGFGFAFGTGNNRHISRSIRHGLPEPVLTLGTLPIVGGSSTEPGWNKPIAQPGNCDCSEAERGN